MANTLIKSEAWANVLQSVLRESFVGKFITNNKFEWEFDGNDTVHFQRLAKISTSDMPSSYSEIPTQALVETDEVFTLNNRKAFSVAISDEDYKELKINPDSQIIQDAAEKFAKDWDDVIFSEYANAGYNITDGNMETATNGWGANSIILNKANVYDMLTAVSEVLDANNVPTDNRFIVISPKEKRFLANSPQLLRDTKMGDEVVVKGGGYLGMINDLKIYFSNNLKTVSNVKHLIAGQGRPISFAANIKPKVTFVDSSTQATNFVNFMKAMTKFGVKTFAEWAERLVDIEIKA